MDMLQCLFFWHIMNNDLEHTCIKGTGKEMIKFWRKSTACYCIISRCCNIFRSTFYIQFNDAVNKFLIDTILSTGKQQLKFIEMIV